MVPRSWPLKPARVSSMSASAVTVARCAAASSRPGVTWSSSGTPMAATTSRSSGPFVDQSQFRRRPSRGQSLSKARSDPEPCRGFIAGSATPSSPESDVFYSGRRWVISTAACGRFARAPTIGSACVAPAWSSRAKWSSKVLLRGYESAKCLPCSALTVADGPLTCGAWRDGWRHLRFMLLLSPQWLFTAPSLLFLVLGGAAFAMLVRGSVPAGGARFDIHTLLLAGSLFLIGYQLLFFGFFVREFAARQGYRRPRRAHRATEVRPARSRRSVRFAVELGGAGTDRHDRMALARYRFRRPRPGRHNAAGRPRRLPTHAGRSDDSFKLRLEYAGHPRENAQHLKPEACPRCVDHRVLR